MLKHLCLLVMMVTTLSCQKIARYQQSSMLVVKKDPCSLKQQIHQLTNPNDHNSGNEAAFYELARVESIKTKIGLELSIKQWLQSLNNFTCNVLSHTECRVALISQNFKFQLIKLKYALNSGTLKVKNVQGQPRIFVKSSGDKPLKDPKQPDGVLERYDNRYYWLFRQNAGDLHPGFIWAKYQGALENDNLEPYHLDTHCFETIKNCTDNTYRKIFGFWNIMIKNGYLLPVHRDFEIQQLYLVNAQKISAFKDDQFIKESLTRSFDAEIAQKIIQITDELMRQRLNPIIKPRIDNGKYEITASTMASLNMEVPFVSRDGMLVYLVDHHRISAAHDLGMAIEVGVFDYFVSFN